MNTGGTRRYLLASLLAATLVAHQVRSALERFQSLRAELHKSHVANDWHANLIGAKNYSEFLNGSPNSLLEVARAQARMSHLPAAFHELEQFVQMKQSSELLTTSDDFAVLRRSAGFAKIAAAMKANSSSISAGSTAFMLHEPSLLTEDIDYDPRAKRFFITSVLEKKLIAVTAAGDETDFAKAPNGWPMLALKVDSTRNMLWATEAALKGFSGLPRADWGRSALLCYGLANGKLLKRIEGPHSSEMGDMTLTEQGDVIVSDGFGGGVYRLLAGAGSLERLDKGDFVSPQTPAVHPNGRLVFVPDYVRGIGVLDIATKQVRWLPMSGRFALAGIDGLYFARGKLIAVQNGTSPERVVMFKLDPSLIRVESETIIEQATDTLGDPTHGVIVGNEFYYIANSGWDAVDDQGNIRPGAKLSAPRIMRVNLSASP